MTDATTGCSEGDTSLYRQGKFSECSGPFHRIEILWTMRGGNLVSGEKPIRTVVCAGHLPGFIESGGRPGYSFTVVSNEVVESPISGERGN